MSIVHVIFSAWTRLEVDRRQPQDEIPKGDISLQCGTTGNTIISKHGSNVLNK